MSQAAASGDLRRKVRRSVPYSIGAGGLQLALSLASLVLLVRYLEPSEYGVWAMLGALGTTINLVISFGYVEFMIRFLPAMERDQVVGRIVWCIVTRRMALAALVSCALVLGFPLYAHSFQLQDYAWHFAVFQIAVCFNLGVLYLNTAFNARFMQREMVLTSFPAQTALVALTALGILLEKPLLFFVWVTTGVAIGNFAVCALVFAGRYGLPPSSGLLVRVPETADQVRYRRLSYVDEWGVNFLSTDIARYLISYFSNNVQVAIYAVATTILTRLQFFMPLSILRPLAAATLFSRYEQTGDVGEIRRIFCFLYDLNNLVSFLFVAAFLPWGRELLAFAFRAAYVEAYAPVLILLFFLVLHFMPIGIVVKALKRPEVLIYSKLTVLLNIALGIPLVITHGATGMAIATAVSVAVKNAIMLFFASRAIELRLPWRATLRCGIAAFGAFAATLLVKAWLPVLVGLAFTTLAYAALLRVLDPLTGDEKRLLQSVSPGPLQAWVPRLVGR